MVHAACWAHARRQFFEAVQLNPRDPVATPIVARMDELFAVDVEARRKTLTTAARHIRRQEIARPLLDDIRSKIVAAQSVALPSSALSKACQYALTLWKKLTRLLGVSRIRAKYQSGGKFHASGGYWSKELVAYRQPAGRTEGCGDSFNSGKLPTVKTPGARLFGRGSSRACRTLDPAPPTPYSSCVGRPTFIDSNDRVVGCRRHGLFGTGMSVWKILRPFDIERKDFRSADIAGEQR
jgi:transposase IS66 family protein